MISATEKMSRFFMLVCRDSGNPARDAFRRARAIATHYGKATPVIMGSRAVGVVTAAGIALSASVATAGPAEDFATVCKSEAVKSEKLATACKAGEAPDTLKDGTRFKAVGIGAEVNTLAANIHFFVKG